ncbi:uncharacterized protein LOC113344038 [Papaver somniferum]|uniref:uncharacterized protein LOC113344038 n=1 Tax=Papaver somniferum TaxID=3469 RepID=UPI000E6F803F|nr:uncharacterized protein LOC113344038 [Papaver somniferum]
MEHILWHCEFSETVWHWLSGIFHCPSPINFDEILSFAKRKSPAIKEVWYICAFNVMVELWFTRNSVIYEDATPSVDKLKMRITRCAKECSFRMKGKRWGTMYDLHILLFFGISGIQVHDTSVKKVFFKYRAQNQILIYCDGASKGNPSLAGIGFIARNQYGDYMGAASGGLGIATNYLAEVMALIVAGEWAITKQSVDVCFSLDSKVVMLDFMNNKIPWMVLNRWIKIKMCIPAISFRHSYREVNFSSDTMAKKGVLLSRGEVQYNEEKPQLLRNLENADDLYFRF